MSNYNFGKVDIEFNTNKIFLLAQMLYRIESLESKINEDNSKVSNLAESLNNFKKVILENKKGLEEFNTFKNNAEEKNMWAEYGEYIASFAQTNMEELQVKNPEMAIAMKNLLDTDFFQEVEQMNEKYSKEMEKRFIGQTQDYKENAENIIGNTNVKKIIYMPFTPELFSIEPCCLSDKNNNGEFAVQFTIPTDKKEFEEMFGMEYTEGIESVILFHEKMHADIPTNSKENFKNPMQRELDSHLKHTIIELLANGEMGIDIANHASSFQSVFHTGKISYKDRTLKTDDLQELGIKDNELLHTEANETVWNNVEHFSKEDMGIIKIRGMMYPYVLMYKNRNNTQQLENVISEIQRDIPLIEEIYGKEFAEKIQNIDFLKNVQSSVKPYNNVLEFAEGMSRELLGIEQVRAIHIDDKYIEQKFERIAGEIASRNAEHDLSFILEGICGEDVSKIDMSNLSPENFRRLTFDNKTIFSDEQINRFHPEKLLEQGKKFSNVKEEKGLHENGINGKGTTIAILDRYFDSSISEFEGRVVKHIVLEKDRNGENVANIIFERNKENDFRKEYKEKYMDGSHGNTTACLVAGSECGVAPETEMYIFSVGNISWEESKEMMLKYIVENNIKLDIISISADIQTSKEGQKMLDRLEKKGCILLDSSKFWNDFSWGRTSNNGEVVLLDELLKTISNRESAENSRTDKVIKNIPSTVILPVAGRTNIHMGEDGKTIYKYNGSLCGASYAIPQIAGLFLLARQIDSSIRYDEFINVVKDPKRLNPEGMMYVDAEEICKEITEREKQVIESQKVQENNEQNLVTPSTIEHDTKEIGLQEINNVVQEIKQAQKQKVERKGQISK